MFMLYNENNALSTADERPQRAYGATDILCTLGLYETVELCCPMKRVARVCADNCICNCTRGR